MKTRFNWKKGLLKNNYQIYSGGREVGYMKQNSFRMTAEAKLNGKNYFYRTMGFFNQTTRISETVDGPEIGLITYNSLRTTAQIEYKNGIANWKNENLNHSRWSLTEHPAVRIAYRGSSMKGELESDTEDAFLILTGLYIANYFWQSLVIIILMLIIVYSVIL